jgi:hypothetical protein
MKILRFSIIAYVILSLIILFQSCSLVRQVTDTLANVQRLKFKLDNVSNFQLAGVSLYDKSSVSSFSVGDGIKLASAFGSKRLPCEFTLSVLAKNPNDGTGGNRSQNATITGLEWRLLIDDVPTVSGNIDKPIEVPGVGASTQIPMRISLDLYQFFQNKGYDGIINIALALGGVKGSPARLKLDVKPTVTIGGFNIEYPGRITVVDKEFN